MEANIVWGNPVNLSLGLGNSLKDRENPLSDPWLQAAS